VTDSGRPVVIRNVTLIDGTGAAPVPGQALIAEGRRISWIGPDGSLPEGAGQGAIDGGGGTILPGLINCHVHLANDGSPDLFGQAARDSVTTAALRGYLNMQVTLESGVTSVRDCGAANGIAIDLARAAFLFNGLSDASQAMTAQFEASFDTIAQFINAPSRENVAVYRNATEALNSVMYSLMTEFRDGDNVVTTMMEHNSNYVPWYALGRKLDAHNCAPWKTAAGLTTTNPGRFWFSVPRP
jgi:cytosine/adenosine deaminase-related metal-dependent hydrolase